MSCKASEVTLWFSVGSSSIPSLGVKLDAEMFCKRLIADAVENGLYSSIDEGFVYSHERIQATRLVEILEIDLGELLKESEESRRGISCNPQTTRIVTNDWAVIDLCEGCDPNIWFYLRDGAEYKRIAPSEKWTDGLGAFKCGCLTYRSDDPYWPLPVFNSQNTALSRLADLITPDDSNPLTALIRSNPPINTLGNQIARELIAIARSILESPVS